MWLADDEQAAEIEKKEAEIAEAEKNAPPGKKRKRKRPEASLDDMYHEGKDGLASHCSSQAATDYTVGEGNFDTSEKPSGAATPVSAVEGAPGPGKRRKGGMSKKAKTARQRLAVADGQI
jgi:DNA helicase INO80